MQNMNIGGDEYSTCMTHNEKRPNMAPSLHLTDEQVQALGLTGARVGDRLVLHADACVSAVSSHEEEDKDGGGKASVSVTLRLDKAEVERGAKPAALTLYGG